MNCHDLDRWLDEGSPEAQRARATLHARICARCLAALRAADELETLLAAAPAAAPAGFAGRVMARVAVTPQAGARVPLTELSPFMQSFPWWVRLALEPACVLAMVLASVLVWRGDALFALAASAAAQLASRLSPAPVVLPADAPWLQPTVLTCIVLGAAPLVFMGSRLLYDWSATLVGPRHARLRAR